MHVIWVTVGALGMIFVGLLWKLGQRLRGEGPLDAEVETLPPDLARRIPPSLHPVIDPSRCIGSAACVPACPEGHVLRLHDGYAHLVEPQHCIGHGACARECPMEAITLVFGTATRGVDIPHVTETFETNVPGVSIAGELGGMGLIRNAVRQGVEATEHIARALASDRAPGPTSPRGGAGSPHDAAGDHRAHGLIDLLVVGAGPAGIAAGLEATRRGLRVQLIDQERDLGGTTAHYPRKKVVMLGALRLPGRKPLRRREISKEELIALWEEVTREAALPMTFGERLTGLEALPDGGFAATTSRGTRRARRVLLALGRRGTPRRLGVPGEDLPKVAYALREPEEWAGARCLVVGGGDAAVEAALALARAGAGAPGPGAAPEGGTDQPPAEVSLSYRGDSFFRTKPANQNLLERAVERGAVRLYTSTVVHSIVPDMVRLVPSASAPADAPAEPMALPNDQVFIFAGGELPTKLLAAAGISMERKFGTR